MALNFRAIFRYPYPPPSSSSSSSTTTTTTTTTTSSSSGSYAPYLRQQALLLKPYFAAFSRSAQSEPTEGGLKEGDPLASLSTSSSSARAQLDLLEQLTSTRQLKDGYESDGVGGRRLKIRDQLAQLVGDRDGEFSLPLGKDLKKVSEKFLTISQKRNIKRQAYLDEVSQRNDSVFFATVGAFVVLPPVIILCIAILTGYVQLFP